MKLHKCIYLMGDLFFVNSNPFFLALSRKIWFTYVNHLANIKVDTIFKAFKEIYSYYMKRGVPRHKYICKWIILPLQAMIYKNIPGRPRINITSANENVPDIECQIRVVQEKTRSVRHSLTFNKIPNILTIYIVFTVFRMINYLPIKGGVYLILRPNTILSGETLCYK